MTDKISILSEEMAKLSNRILTDLENFLVESDGNLKDIDSGTHIKIPTGAGFVNFYKSQNSCEITFWLKETLLNEPEEQEIDLMDNYT